MCHVLFNLPILFIRAANRPDQSLHRLNRSLDDFIYLLKFPTKTGLDDHPRSTFHCPRRAP